MTSRYTSFSASRFPVHETEREERRKGEQTDRLELKQTEWVFKKNKARIAEVIHKSSLPTGPAPLSLLTPD